jgi:RNA polymerase sigma factor (sigma-70 family)
MTMVGAAGDSRPDEIDGIGDADDQVDTDRPDDRALLARLRAGDDGAFGELFARHGSAVRGYAFRYTNDIADAEDLAAEAFFRVLLAVRRGHGPDNNVRGYLLTVVRRVAAESRVRRRDVPTPDEALNRVPEPTGDRMASHAEANLIARAFASLPQRWRSVLWQMEVQGERPAVVADQFGLSANATAALARRARVGLRAAYLQAHVASATGPSSCRTVVDKLGAYTAGSLRGRAALQVRGHLAGCASCRALHTELADVCAGLRRHAGQFAPSVLGAVTISAHGLAAPGPLAHGSLAHGAVHASAVRHLAALAGKAAAFGARIKLAVAATSVTVAGGVGVAVVPLLIHALPSDHAAGMVLDLQPPTVLSAPLLTPLLTPQPAPGQPWSTNADWPGRSSAQTSGGGPALTPDSGAGPNAPGAGPVSSAGPVLADSSPLGHGTGRPGHPDKSSPGSAGRHGAGDGGDRYRASGDPTTTTALPSSASTTSSSSYQVYGGSSNGSTTTAPNTSDPQPTTSVTTTPTTTGTMVRTR